MRSGVRWAETTFASKGTPSCVSMSAAWRIVSQSERLPMMMPTTGVSSAMLDPLAFRPEKRCNLGTSRCQVEPLPILEVEAIGRVQLIVEYVDQRLTGG